MKQTTPCYPYEQPGTAPTRLSLLALGTAAFLATKDLEAWLSYKPPMHSASFPDIFGSELFRALPKPPLPTC